MVNQEWSLVYTQELFLRFRDLDAFGHVNNSVFFTYFEQTRLGWWDKAIALDITREATIPVLISASCTYLKPIFYPENIAIELYTKPPGNSSYELFYQVHSQKKSEVIYAEGLTKTVWIDRKTGKPVPLPDYVRKHFPTSST